MATACCSACGVIFEFEPIPNFRQEFYYCRREECIEKRKGEWAALKQRVEDHHRSFEWKTLEISRDLFSPSGDLLEQWRTGRMVNGQSK